MYRKWIGIDPGLQGAVAVLPDLTLFDTPTITVKGRRLHLPILMADFLSQYSGSNCLVAIEKVHSMPKQGVASTFSLGEGFGLWEGMTAAFDMATELITANKWKRNMLGTNAHEKDYARLIAIQLFPEIADQLSLKKHHGRADALLLAEYLRRTTS